MRSMLLAVIVSALLSPMMLQAQANAKADIEISAAVLKTAEWAGFKYMEVLDKATIGDQKGLLDFFEFSGTVDGTEAIQHALTCIELIPIATDDKFGPVVYILKPKLRSVLLERFQLAQGRTKKEALKKPLQEWAPLTWKALHGELVTCSSCHQAGLTKSDRGAAQAAKAGTAQPAKLSIEATDTVAPTVKQ